MHLLGRFDQAAPPRVRRWISGLELLGKHPAVALAPELDVDRYVKDLPLVGHGLSYNPVGVHAEGLDHSSVATLPTHVQASEPAGRHSLGDVLLFHLLHVGLKQVGKALRRQRWLLRKAARGRPPDFTIARQVLEEPLAVGGVPEAAVERCVAAGEVVHQLLKRLWLVELQAHRPSSVPYEVERRMRPDHDAAHHRAQQYLFLAKVHDRVVP
mmetsp:Transcript_85455/g.226985  ORF Transcript_85455/g.226985 Transcript_85455/m.226985 type:complete len:212 (-) Transcript_85455:651-1286(-)